MKIQLYQYMRQNEVQIPKPSKNEKKKKTLSRKSYYSVPAHPDFCSITDLSFLLSALLHCKNYKANHQITI